MKRVIQLILLAVLASGFAAAQAPMPTAKLPEKSEGGKNQVYGGFLYEPTDWGPAWDKYLGINFNYTRTIHKRFGVVADFDWTKNNGSNINDLDRGTAHNSTEYAYRVGPRVNLLVNHRFQPYVVLLFGGAHMTSIVPYPGHNSPLMQKDWFGLTWAAGGGLDVRLSHRFGVRGQWDATKVPWGTEAIDVSHWDRISFGGTFRW